MTELINMIIRFLRAFQLWVVISPWEQGLRVRWGKYVKLIGRGVHLKLPFVDTVFVQTVRLRVNNLGRQTISTRDGKTISLTCSVGYAINNIELLYNTLHHAEDTIANISRSCIADYIAHHELADCHPSEIEAHINSSLDFGCYGLCRARISVIEAAVVVKTYRLIGDYSFYQVGSSLQTDGSTVSGAPR